MKRFSDFAENTNLEGNKIPVEVILGKTIIVRNYRLTSSKFKSEDTYLTLQIEMNGELMVIFTGSRVLIDHIKKYHNELPFEAKIIKINKYYTFV